MKYKQIQNTDLSISVISLGTWVFSGDAWGGAPEQECIDAVNAAVEYGINLIDTAPIYGYGRSEEIVGKAIKGKHNKIILATKCGLKGKGAYIENNLTASFIREEIENSLKRLGVDYIDLYQCHWPDPNTPIEETIKQMCALQKEGKIRYIALSNYSLKQLKEALCYANIVTIQDHYSLLERSLEKELLGFCQEKRIGILTYGSLGGGILTGKYRTQTKFDSSDARSFFYKFYNGKNFQKSEKLVNILKEISSKTKRPLNQIALNWVRQKKGITSAIVGARNAEQAEANALAAEWELSQEDFDILQAV